MDNFITSLGKNIKIVFEPTITNVSTDNHDSVRNTSIKRPEYKDPTDLTTVENSRMILGLIKWNPTDFENYSDNIRKNDTLLRLKTFMLDVPDLLRCKYIIPNFDSSAIFQPRFTLIRQAMPRGIKEDRYAYTYWSSSDAR